MSSGSNRPILAATAALAATTFVASYAIQRLVASTQPEPPAHLVMAVEHIPYYWRVYVAVFHALALAILAGFGLRAHHADAVLRYAHVWVPGVAIPSMIAMVLVP